jgi:hypothetical protein
MKNEKLPYKTLNLFESYNADIPFTDKLYKWITTVGRYIVIGVELVVLSSFVARFFVDQNLNDLKLKVETNNAQLERNIEQEKYFLRLFEKLNENQKIQLYINPGFITEIKKVYQLASTDIYIESIAADENSITVNGKAQNKPLQAFKQTLETNIFGGAIKITELDVTGSSLGDGSFSYKLTETDAR